MKNRIVEMHCTNPDPRAMGRLATWAVDDFNRVDIYNDGKDDFVAHYSDTEHDRKYVIGAIWRKETEEFTFHS